MKQNFTLARLENNYALFPLTLTLSLGERGQPLEIFLNLLSCGAEFSRDFAKSLGAFLPLLGGEGRGEGKRSILKPKLCNFS